MPRSIWKGSIAFGLLQIPVNLVNAEKRYDLHFNLVDNRNHARIRYERVNEETGEEVPWNDIIKAFEYDKGNYVFLSDEDFERVEVEAAKSVEIHEFVDRESISTLFYDRPYYITPGSGGERGYALLREALKRTGKVGVAKVIIRSKQYLAAIAPLDNALVLNLLRFAQEIRPVEDMKLPEGNWPDLGIGEPELNLAEQLIHSMSEEWQPEKYRDDYRDALMDWIERKVEAERAGREPEPAPVEEETSETQVIDIMTLLKQSLQEKEKTHRRGEKRPHHKKAG